MSEAPTHVPGSIQSNSAREVAQPALLIIALAAASTLACASFHGLHSARALAPHEHEVGVELSHQSVPATYRPLGGVDPRIETSGVDLSGRLGLGAEADFYVRMGSSGLEGSLLRQLTDPGNRWFAVAGLVSTRGRLVFAPTGQRWRLLDVVVSFPVEVDPHPRLALIVEPKGIVSVGLGCSDAGTSCAYFPFHAGVSAGGRLRLYRGLTLGVEGAWYPTPFNEQDGVVPRPTSWEASVSFSWLFASNDG